MKIVVDGDTYEAVFFLRGHSIKLRSPKGRDDWSDDQDLLIPLWVGVEYLCEATHEVLPENDKTLIVKRAPSAFSTTVNPVRYFELQNFGEDKPDYRRPGKKLPFLDCRDEGSRLHFPRSPLPSDAPTEPTRSGQLEEDDILIERVASRSILGLPELENISVPIRRSGDKCKVHIQIGRADKRDDLPVPIPSDVRIVIVSLRDLVGDVRIRKSISYESILVDVLRHLRKYAAEPNYESIFYRLTGLAKRPDGKGPAVDDAPNDVYIIVRINHAAALVYRWRKSEPDKDCGHAFLVFHPDLPAPMRDVALGRVDGFSGFLAAHLAAEAKAAYDTGRNLQEEHGGGLPPWLKRAVCRGILWQVAQARRGALRLFFHDRVDPLDESVSVLAEPEWQPILQPSWGARPGFFNDLRQCMKLEEDWDPGNPAELDACFAKLKLIRLRVEIAVSHRMQWFLAGDKLVEFKEGEAPLRLEVFETAFRETAHRWLTDPRSKPKNDIPLVTIEQLQLMDRREVEDYLALRDAFRNYEKDEKELRRPLNIAVFGAPGAGKSFGVTQVVSFASKLPGSRINPETLTFNLSQFTSLNDLVTALHLVRNECLKNRIPVVFLDEFDSAFEGRAFGWLKFFLAPMQDGEFTDGGRTYRLGPCVLVFAGGVNRSFEELNGRLRNPSFVEAKGPDFISRLRAHLNIRGINKPEDDVDQSRYLLRRAIMLHSMLSRRLKVRNGNLPTDGLLTLPVARAFCGIGSFKHGARSMEAILDMCDVKRGSRITASDLPAKAQLEMHVDAAEFMNFISGTAL